MANVWDDLMKMLVRAHPQDFVSLVFNGARYVGDVTNELKVRSVEADFLCNAKLGKNNIVVHVNFSVIMITRCSDACGSIIVLPIT